MLRRRGAAREVRGAISDEMIALAREVEAREPLGVESVKAAVEDVRVIGACDVVILGGLDLASPFVLPTLALSQSENEPRLPLDRPRTCGLRSDTLSDHTEARKFIVTCPPTTGPVAMRVQHGRRCAAGSAWDRKSRRSNVYRQPPV